METNSRIFHFGKVKPTALKVLSELPLFSIESIRRSILVTTRSTFCCSRLHSVCRWIIPWWTKARDFNTVGFVFVNSTFCNGSYIIMECRLFRNSLPQFCHSATFYSAKWHSATRPNGKNIPQKIIGNQPFGKKAFGNIYSENVHSEKNIKKFDNRQLFIPQNEIWKNRLSETSYSEK